MPNTVQSFDVRTIDAELAKCDLTFKEQCKIVYEGVKKGVVLDGCTGVPDFNFGYDCCGEHDVHYQLNDVSRAVADKKLFNCILKKGLPIKVFRVKLNTLFPLAAVFYIGVRLFGWRFYGAKHRNNQNVESQIPPRDISGP